MKEKKRTPRKPIQSTQQNIPIKDLISGYILTDRDEYVKVLEILPQPFHLKRPDAQNKISDAFFAALKSAPPRLHFKSVSIPADLSHQIEGVKESLANEKSLSCRKMGEEYIKTLKKGQKEGVTRRFFLSFPFRGKSRGIGKSEFSDIYQEMETDTLRLTASLNACGNDVIDGKGEGVNIFPARILYMLYNRLGFLDESFESHLRKRYDEYKRQWKDKQFYIPVSDYIAPKKMSTQNAKYLVIDDMYYSFLYIPSNGYNPDVITGWLDNFITSFLGVDVDIFLERIPKERVLSSIRRSISQAKVSLSETTDATDSFDSAAGKLSSGYYLKDGLISGQDFYEMAIILTVCGESPKEVEYKKAELKKMGRQLDITLHENIFRCEKTFEATMPFGMYDSSFMKKMRRNVLTDGAASLYPFTTFQLADSKGLYIADDLTGSPCILDPFNRKRFSNPHIFICGETGAGKTITLMMIALRARVRHMPVFILAPEKQDEFRRVCDAIGGQFVSIGAGSSQRINIMEIFPKNFDSQKVKKVIDGVDALGEGSFLEEKVATLMEFFQIQMPKMDPESKQLLNEAILKTYEKFGITPENESLWEDKALGKYKEMPILSDLVKTLEERKETVRLSHVVKLLTMGTGAHFNGKTNVNVDNDFFVIGLEHNTKELLGLSIYMAMDYCWNKIKEDRTKNKFLFIDEWWKLAFHPIAADKSLEISKVARAYSCSMVLATQQMSDILAVENGKYGNAVLGNCATKILMSMKEKDVYSVRDMIGLSQSECESILRFKPGEGLLVAGESRMQLHFNPSDTEKLLTFTDNETLLRYAKMKREGEFEVEKEESPIISHPEPFGPPKPHGSLYLRKSKQNIQETVSPEDYLRNLRNHLVPVDQAFEGGISHDSG